VYLSSKSGFLFLKTSIYQLSKNSQILALSIGKNQIEFLFASGLAISISV
jgi:hypothetical protein